MIFARRRARRASKAVIEQILGEIVAAARRPTLYRRFEAPDRIDGRFELLTLHAGLVLRRLAALGGLADAMAQELVNSVFIHFDDTLREMGVSDIAVSRRVKAMAGAFYGRNARLRRGSRQRFKRRGSRRRSAEMSMAHQPRAPPHAPPPSPTMSSRLTPPWPQLRSKRSRPASFAFPRAQSRQGNLMTSAEPFSRLIRVDALPKSGQTVTIEASPAEREALASFLKLPAIAALAATLHIERAARDGVRVTGSLHGEFTQICVVSLEPFDTSLDEPIDVRFAARSAEDDRRAPSDEAHTVSLSEEDEPDPIVDGKIDIGALAAEFFALGLDPYPRKPGAAFNPPDGPEPTPSPFSALAERARREPN